MNIKAFQARQFEQQYQYRSFLPTFINCEWILSDPQTLTLIEEVTRRWVS